VSVGADGRLAYKRTPAGDRIMDFSHAGYMGGGVALPEVPVRRTVQPSKSKEEDRDDTALIQDALDAVSKMPPDERGFRGAVLLGPGRFTCAETIRIQTSGVVLRGSGAGPAGGERTTIKLAGRPHVAISMRVERRGGREERDDAAVQRTKITDRYVPSGSTSFTVADASGFAAGDAVEVRRPVTEAWVKFMHMDDLVRDGKPQTWIRAGNTIATERRVAAVSGNTVTLDAPLSDCLDAKYVDPPGATLVKLAGPRPGRVSQCGVEALHILSPPQAISHEQPHFSALRISGEDCWARDVVAEETMNSVGVGGRRITLQRVGVERAALHQGSSKPAEFAPNGTQVLLDRCTVRGDNIWFCGTGAAVAGPIVLLNCTFTGNGRAESHQRWSTGMLYDNVRAPDGGLDFKNRGAMGSGHGWTMGWGVAWNCAAKDYTIQQPPGAMNWMIGCTGATLPKARPFDEEPFVAEATKDSPGTPVAPESLYLAQLAERLGPQALKNIGY
jgi:hypothetical protein